MRNVQSYKNQIIMYTYERLFSLCVNLFSAKHHRRKHCIAKPFGDAGDAAFVHSSLLLNEKMKIGNHQHHTRKNFWRSSERQALAEF